MVKINQRVKNCTFSIIIPVFHEADTINPLLESLTTLDGSEPFEIIVVEGSPTKDTLQVITTKDIIFLSSEQGRARQMNAGAAVANGEILIFLHADTFLPHHALSLIKNTLQDPDLVGGAFRLQIDSKKWLLRIIANVSTLRSRITRAPYGDQVIFLRKNFFDEIGGYTDIPLMEDVALMRRIKQEGGHIRIFDEYVTTSARRWDQEGLFYTTLRDSVIIFLYWCGVPAKKLTRFYPSQPDTTSKGSQ
jgi:rSAM/selenodomain-associated transferase 2